MRNNEHYKSALLLCKRWLYLFFALFVGIDLCAQNINVKGKVVDENSLAIIGANIVSKETKKGTISDIDGNFELSVPVGDKLVISFIGYETKEIAVKSAMTDLTIVLKENLSMLDEVVVTGVGLAQ